MFIELAGKQFGSLYGRSSNTDKTIFEEFQREYSICLIVNPGVERAITELPPQLPPPLPALSNGQIGFKLDIKFCVELLGFNQNDRWL